MIFVIHQYELSIGIHVSPPSWTSLLHLPPYLIPLGCHRTPTLCALLHASNPHWLLILHMAMYMIQCYSLKTSYLLFHPLNPKVCSFITSWFNSDQISCYFFFPVSLFPILIRPIFSLCAKFMVLLHWENGIRQETLLFNTITNRPHPQPYFSRLSLQQWQHLYQSRCYHRSKITTKR